MRIEGQRRSDNFEDRGRGGGVGRAAGVPVQALLALVNLLGFKGTLLAGAVQERAARERLQARARDVLRAMGADRVAVTQ